MSSGNSPTCRLVLLSAASQREDHICRPPSFEPEGEPSCLGIEKISAPATAKDYYESGGQEFEIEDGAERSTSSLIPPEDASTNTNTLTTGPIIFGSRYAP